MTAPPHDPDSRAVLEDEAGGRGALLGLWRWLLHGMDAYADADADADAYGDTLLPNARLTP